MTPVSWPRVLLGGMIAGIVINSSEYLLDSFVFIKLWEVAISTLKSPYFSQTTIIASLQILGFAAGIVTLRRYAATSSHSVSGRRSALRAALFGWSLTYVPLCLALIVLKLIPTILAAIVAASGLIELVCGALLGCWIYEETRTAALRAARASDLIQEPYVQD
jgi:hypothetical protein